jgi:hypothetical protein
MQQVNALMYVQRLMPRGRDGLFLCWFVFANLAVVLYCPVNGCRSAIEDDLGTGIISAAAQGD